MTGNDAYVALVRRELGLKTYVAAATPYYHLPSRSLTLSLMPCRTASWRTSLCPTQEPSARCRLRATVPPCPARSATAARLVLLLLLLLSPLGPALLLLRLPLGRLPLRLLLPLVLLLLPNASRAHLCRP